MNQAEREVTAPPLRLPLATPGSHDLALRSAVTLIQVDNIRHISRLSGDGARTNRCR